MTLRFLIYIYSYLSQPKQCLREIPHRPQNDKKGQMLILSLQFKKAVLFFQSLLEKEDQKKHAIFLKFPSNRSLAT